MVEINGNETTEMVETKKVPDKRNAADFTSKYDTDVNENNLTFPNQTKNKNNKKLKKISTLKRKLTSSWGIPLNKNLYNIL